MTRLAYLGPSGTFTEEAALRYQPSAQLLPFASEAAVAAAVESGMADEGVLAIENSLEGSVTRTIDVLIHESRLFIKSEVILPIEHCLIVRPGTAADDVSVIYAHPQALSQCRRFIELRFPNARQEAALSNAAAVEEILNVPGGAAIAGARAAELHGAQILARGIQDNPHNKTRFAVLGPTDSEPTGRDKTSIAFTVAHDQPGTLVGVLHELSDRSINLVKIESRPSREELGIYVFLVDLEGHRTDPTVAEALAAVQAKAFFFRVLGSYPRWDDARDP
ncbi:MAG: prephenate dehydratase [Chloroflexi bacterium RBG_16_68_14]|nr:MAG: prephenate dehydratase [Chloroflexi bacterium RBG_16_68_14]